MAKIDRVWVSIGGRDYGIMPYGGISGLKILLRIGKCVGPAAESLIRGFFGLADKAETADLSGLHLGAFPAAILQEGPESLLSELFSEVLVRSGDSENATKLTTTRADDLFRGEVENLFRLLGEVLKVNYAPFLKTAFSEGLKLYAELRSSFPSGQGTETETE